MSFKPLICMKVENRNISDFKLYISISGKDDGISLKLAQTDYIQKCIPDISINDTRDSIHIQNLDYKG